MSQFFVLSKTNVVNKAKSKVSKIIKVVTFIQNFISFEMLWHIQDQKLTICSSILQQPQNQVFFVITIIPLGVVIPGLKPTKQKYQKNYLYLVQIFSFLKMLTGVDILNLST
jgi:hypothetical protein